MAVFSSAACLVSAQTLLTIDSAARKMTGGVGTLDREQYFNYHGSLVPPANSNLGNLVTETWSESGLNLAPGRVSTELDQFISQNLPEDPSRPDYIDPTAARNKINGDYRNFVLNSSRWEPLRRHENAIFVQSGRNGGFWPNYLDSGTQMPTNFDAYAEFVNIYLEEAVYGPSAFLPIQQDRFYFEVMNEPQWTGTPWSQVIEMHQVLTERIKEQFPQARVGGATCCDVFEDGQTNSWDRMRLMIDDMANWQTASGQAVELDYWSIHTYERYDVAANGSHSQAVFQSPGHVEAIMDLFEAYGNNALGDPKKFAVSEYGSFNRTNMADGSYGSYARDHQQWDLTRDVREQMLVFMRRPDRIINATPFVSPRHWQNAVPTNPAGDNVFFEQVAGGNWVETIVGKTFRMYSQIKGEYVDIAVDDPDLQSAAFRDGNTLYVMMNNLRETAQNVDLTALTGLGQVAGASWSRVFRANDENFYLPDVDISAGWQSLTLEPEAGAVLTLTLDGPEVYDRALDTDTYYADRTEIEILPNLFLATSVDADIEDAVSAKLRFGYSALNGSLPAFSVMVNGLTFPVSSEGLELDDNDFDLIVREIDIPAVFLRDGANDISFLFPSGSSGEVSAAVLEVTRSIGDFDGSGALGGGDVNALYQQFGPAGAGSKHDLNEDGTVDNGDVGEWLALRNASVGDTDVDGDIDTRDAVATLSHQGSAGAIVDWTHGNFNGDTEVNGLDLLEVVFGFTGAGEFGSTGTTDAGVSADNPDLVYDPETGELSIDPDGLEIAAFHLSGLADFLTQADFSALDADVGETSTIVDNTASDIGWVTADAGPGIGYDAAGLASLGLLLPAGMDLAALAAWFDDASWAGFGVGGAFDFVVIEAALTGDFDADGVVDAADFTVWRDTLGSTTDLRADANGDLVVDADDYLLWRGNFGAGSAASAASAPEPAAIALALAASVFALVHRRRACGFPA